MLVRDIMITEVTAFSPSATIAQIASAMRDQRIAAVPLVEGARLVGLITARDIVTRVVADGLDPNQEQASLHMSCAPIAAAPDWSLEQAGETMRRAGVKRLPVVADGRLVGYLSLSDLRQPRERAVGAVER